jgi:putative FmdB family regulatory protein
MPFYDFQCGCGNTFNVRASVKALEDKEIECPECGSRELSRVFGPINYIPAASLGSGNDCPNAHVCGARCRH